MLTKENVYPCPLFGVQITSAGGGNRTHMRILSPRRVLSPVRLTNFATPASFDDTIISVIVYEWPGGEEATRRSAKPLCEGANPSRASIEFAVIKHEIYAREA